MPFFFIYSALAFAFSANCFLISRSSLLDAFLVDLSSENTGYREKCQYSLLIYLVKIRVVEKNVNIPCRFI